MIQKLPSFRGIFKPLSILALVACSCLGAQKALAQVSVSATAATAGPTAYTSLKTAFDAVNAGTHQGAITITISANTTEPASAVLNRSGSGSASYTSVVVKPATGATPTISGNVSTNGVFRLNAASNVTIDGSNNGTTTRNLTITNTSTTSPFVGILNSIGTTAFSNVVVKNCNIINGAQTGSALVAFDSATTTAITVAGRWTNLTIQNNDIQKAYMGVFLAAVVATGNGANTLVTQNQLNGTGTNAIRLVGLYLQGVSGGTVTNNVIANIDGANNENDRGIWLASGTTNTTVRGNTISSMNYTGAGGFSAAGIAVSPAATNTNINIDSNSISGISTTATTTNQGIYLFGASTGVTIQRNKVDNIANTNSGGYGAAGIHLASTSTASNTRVINNFVTNVRGYGYSFGYGTSDNGNGIVIDAGGGYSLYHNTVALTTNSTTSTNGAALLVSSSVTAASTLDIRNNIFANFQTTGTGGRFAMVSNAANTVFSNLNFNDYYATSGNLTRNSGGTTATTLAGIVSGHGGNANSTITQPAFTSATDLHLLTTAAGNGPLNNAAVPISTITNDIDNEVRSTTVPDIGADEFGTCTGAAVAITANPVNSTICVNTNTSFSVTAATNQGYQWQVNTGSGFVNIASVGVYSGTNTNTLNITAAPTSMSGYTYRCMLANSPICYTSPTTAATLTVQALPTATVTPTAPAPVCGGDSIQLTATTNTGVAHQWRLNGVPIAGATALTYKAFVSGSYTFSTATAIGCANTSATASNVIISPRGPATISYSGPLSFCAGGAVVLQAYTGTGLVYQWRRNGQLLSDTTSFHIASQTGVYTLRVNNPFNCPDSSAGVSVTVFPVPVPVVTANGNTLNTGIYAGYQWYRNNQPITGAVLQNFGVTQNGSYHVRVVDQNGCEGVSEMVFFGTVGVKTVSGAGSEILVYPNPASNYLIVENKDAGTRLRHIYIVNTLGAVVKEASLTGAKETIQLGDLASGIYNLRIETDKGVMAGKVQIVH